MPATDDSEQTCEHNLRTELIESITPLHISRFGISSLKQTGEMTFQVEGYNAPVKAVINDRLILGRLDPAYPGNIDIDLTSFRAREQGVSRRHARIQWSERLVFIVDLGSLNGTYLNGLKLLPDLPRVLRDGDELRLGKLVLHVRWANSQPN